MGWPEARCAATLPAVQRRRLPEAGECADEARFLARSPGSRQKSSGQAEACPQSSKVRYGEQEPIKDPNRADRLHNQLEPSVSR
jgi:hypothetical protein